MACFTICLPKSPFPKHRMSMNRVRMEPGKVRSIRSSQFNLDEYLATKEKLVNEALDKAIPLRHPLKIHESMRYTLISGRKRTTGILTLASCELVGGTEATAMPVVCAAEMINAMWDILDDLPCMDNGDLRRGQPTNHLAFGEDTAILSGVALLSLAFEHVATKTVGVSLDRIVRVLAELGSAVGSEGVAAGQLVDLASEGEEVDLGVLEYIHLHKTARLAEAVAVCGAIVGGGEVAEVERVRRYARCVGLLFQVVDDILDVTKTTEEMGKTSGRDVALGKATYPKLMGIDKALEFAQELLVQAQEELSYFDQQRAAPLHHLARYYAYRQN